MRRCRLVNSRPKIFYTTNMSAMKAISQNENSPIYAKVTLLHWILQSPLGYDTVIRHAQVMAAGSNFAFKIAAKPLQIDRDMVTIDSL